MNKQVEIGDRQTLLLENGTEVEVVVVGYCPPILTVKIVDPNSIQMGEVWDIEMQFIH
jgi:hypothetical protein